MANTGTVFGADIQLYRNTGTDQAPVWEAFAHATSHSYSASTNMREISDKDDGGNTAVKPGRHGAATISISGMVSYDGDDFFAIEALRLARTKIQVKYSGRPSADTLYIDTKEAAGDSFYTANGYISECSREDPHDGESTYSATITLSGKPTVSTVSGT